MLAILQKAGHSVRFLQRSAMALLLGASLSGDSVFDLLLFVLKTEHA
ncbi:hypothetical protein TERTU_2068 [Teredinibacter turnerae T7901]|uniref:Uncharacterized protein n=1 Tax=Teredinibacter turnerae (strain ATCC 39867 / T7901) TaxID=377629 RepID=C5BIT2_TERTT|nr:hypothetical protein TERTU_2068 [Teredinibacter turnerae T7901]